MYLYAIKFIKVTVYGDNPVIYFYGGEKTYCNLRIIQYLYFVFYNC